MATTSPPDTDTTTFAKTAVATLGDGPIALAGTTGEPITLPPHVAALVREMLQTLAAGRDVQLEPTTTEMTPTEAAAYLNVSRPHLVKVLDDGKIPFRMVGTHRRIPTADLITYKRVSRARQSQAMDELVRLSEGMGLYDSDGPPPPKDTFRGKASGGR